MLEKLRKGGHVTKIQGKDFVLFSGLLELAHENGLESIDTECLNISFDNNRALFKATAKGTRGVFVGHGDAMPGNLSKMILPSFPRMAETRSICRALRLYLGIGMCAKEELPSGEGESSNDKGRRGVGDQRKEPWNRNTEEPGPSEKQLKYLGDLARPMGKRLFIDFVRGHVPSGEVWWDDSGQFRTRNLSKTDVKLMIEELAPPKKNHGATTNA